MPLTFRIHVDAPPDQVFSYVKDMTRHKEWANSNASLDIEPVSGGGPAAGSKYRSKAVFLKQPVSADLTITDYEPPSKFAFSVVHHQEGKKDINYHQAYAFRPEGNGTTVERTIGGGPGLLTYLFYPAIRADAMAALRNLKALAERNK